MSNVTDRLINHTQGEAIVTALQTIAQKSESPYNSSNKLNPEYIDVGTLADGMTTTTQISSDASNKLATTKYVHDITDEKQDSLTTEQLAAVNSGITAERLKNIETTLDNKANTSTTYTKTEVDTALSGKQPTLTTAQLAAVNSGITDDDVEQIDLNKNNILSIYNTGFAQKNVMRIVLDEVKALLPSQPFVGNTTIFGNLSVTFNEDNSITLNGSHTAAVAINFKDLSHINMPTDAVGAASANITLSNDIFFGLWGDSGVSNLVLNDGADIPSDYASKYSRGFVIRVSANTVCNNVRIYPMVCDKALYQASSEVVPYALPNTTITPALKECVDNGAKNEFNINSVSVGVNAVINTATGTITQGSTDDTKTNLQFVVKGLLNGSLVSGWIIEPTNITTNGIYTFRFAKTSAFDTIRFGHNGSTQDFNVLYPISNLENKSYILRINITNCVQSQGKYTFTDIMLCTEAEWNVSHKYQPYAMCNAELTSKALRKQTILQANDDFNSVTSNGMYKFNGGPANNPAGSSGAYGILLVITFDNYTVQLCYDFLNGVYYRNKVSSWSAWTKFN